MADTLVDVPGVGRVVFPDGMSDADIADAIKTKILPQASANNSFDAPSRMAAQPQPAPKALHLAPGRFGIDPSYLGTRLANIASGIVGVPRAMSDLEKAGPAGMPVEPIGMVGQFMPSASDISGFIHKRLGLPETNTPGEAGKILDTGVESAISGFAGGPSAVLPAFVGGAGSQAAGDLPGVKGTPYEPFVRAGTGLVLGGATALGQNAVGSVYQGAKNALGVGAPETTAARIVGNALNRDKMAADELAPAGPDQPLFTGGGENVRGALRGSVAPPGPARTTFQTGAQNYLSGADKRATDAVTANVSDLPPMGTRQADLAEIQRYAATPAYEASGIPRRPAMLAPARTVQFAMDEPPVQIPAQWNTPIVTSPRLEQLAQDSAPIKSAIASARGLSDYKALPQNSMTMWDEAYKQLGGMEREAVRAGNGHMAMKIREERLNLRDALTDVNPRYGRALAAYSEPQDLIDASQAGYDAFKSNVPGDVARTQFTRMPDDQQREFLGGVAQWLRDQAGKTQGETAPGQFNMPATAAEKMFNTQAVADRLKAILPPDKYEAFAKAMVQDKLGAQSMRAIAQGSRTVPMGLEAADNAGQTIGLMGDVARGRFGSAMLRGVNALAGRIGQGRNEAVNNEVARMLTATDPAQVGLVRSLAERARLADLARSQGRRNALVYGAGVPALYGTDR